ncbi:hypothetical protein C8J57DRAFT_1476620 [Mycena rebaudengoi]|nr:hypothetical protein C8J57DRAFT_1476620 [Mycena rebaudengoi]
MTSNGGVQDGRATILYPRKIAVLRAEVASPFCEGGWPAARYEALRALREGPTGDMREVHRRGEPSLTKRAARGRCAGECPRLHARLEWRAGRRRIYALRDLRAARSCRDMAQRGRDKGGANGPGDRIQRRGGKSLTRTRTPPTEHVVPPSRTVRIHNETCITRKMAPSPRIPVYHVTPRRARRGSISKPPVIAHHTQHGSATPQSTVSAPPARDVSSITDPDSAVLHLHSVKHAKELRTVKHGKRRPRVKIWSTARRRSCGIRAAHWLNEPSPAMCVRRGRCAGEALVEVQWEPVCGAIGGGEGAGLADRLSQRETRRAGGYARKIAREK